MKNPDLGQIPRILRTRKTVRKVNKCWPNLFCWKVSYLSFLKPFQANSYDFPNNLNEISNTLTFSIFYRKRMVDTTLKSWDIIFYDKNNLVNTCWPHDAIIFFEFSLKSQKLNLFTILQLLLESTKVNKCWLNYYVFEKGF